MEMSVQEFLNSINNPRTRKGYRCRCGKSRNKPYCDGAHELQRFNGTETASNKPYLENVKEYLGPELKLTDKRDLCVGAAFCVREASIKNLVVYSDRPGFKEVAIEEAANCFLCLRGL